MLHNITGQLHYNAVPEETLGFLKQLQALPMLASAYLVGGTALALYVGHRISEDLDIFLPEGFETEMLAQEIQMLAERINTDFVETGRAKNTLSGRIGAVKFDIITFAYPMLNEVRNIDTLRLASVPDIAAMKLSAVVNRGAKKDFWDVHHLLQLATLADLLHYFSMKFHTRDTMHIVRALTYFDDAEAQPDPFALLPVSWASIKKDITNAVQVFVRS